MDKNARLVETMDSAIERLQKLIKKETDDLTVSIRTNVTIDLWRTGHVVGFNYFTNRLLVADEKGFIIYYAEIRNPDGTELTPKEYESKVREIGRIQREALNNLVND